MDMDLSEMASMMRDPNGMKNMMMRDTFETPDGTAFSQADLIADVINILRMDTKRIAEAHDINVEIQQMTPGRAAELLQGVANGQDMGLIEIFDEIEDQRMLVLEELEGEDAVDEYSDMKQSLLYTTGDTEDTTNED